MSDDVVDRYFESEYFFRTQIHQMGLLAQIHNGHHHGRGNDHKPNTSNENNIPSNMVPSSASHPPINNNNFISSLDNLDQLQVQFSSQQDITHESNALPDISPYYGQINDMDPSQEFIENTSSNRASKPSFINSTSSSSSSSNRILEPSQLLDILQYSSCSYSGQEEDENTKIELPHGVDDFNTTGDEKVSHISSDNLISSSYSTPNIQQIEGTSADILMQHDLDFYPQYISNQDFDSSFMGFINGLHEPICNGNSCNETNNLGILPDFRPESGELYKTLFLKPNCNLEKVMKRTLVVPGHGGNEYTPIYQITTINSDISDIGKTSNGCKPVRTANNSENDNISDSMALSPLANYPLKKTITKNLFRQQLSNTSSRVFHRNAGIKIGPTKNNASPSGSNRNSTSQSPINNDGIINGFKLQYSSCQSLIQSCIDTIQSAISYSGQEHLTVLDSNIYKCPILNSSTSSHISKSGIPIQLAEPDYPQPDSQIKEIINQWQPRFPKTDQFFRIEDKKGESFNLEELKEVIKILSSRPPRRINYYPAHQLCTYGDIGNGQTVSEWSSQGTVTHSKSSETRKAVNVDPSKLKSDNEVPPHLNSKRRPNNAYDPTWVRKSGKQKEGWCDHCENGGYHLMKNSGYLYHKNHEHGIFPNGNVFEDPLVIQRKIERESKWEGLCGICYQWIDLDHTERKHWGTWYRHYKQCANEYEEFRKVLSATGAPIELLEIEYRPFMSKTYEYE